MMYRHLRIIFILNFYFEICFFNQAIFNMLPLSCLVYPARLLTEMNDRACTNYWLVTVTAVVGVMTNRLLTTVCAEVCSGMLHVALVN